MNSMNPSSKKNGRRIKSGIQIRPVSLLLLVLGNLVLLGLLGVYFLTGPQAFSPAAGQPPETAIPTVAEEVVAPEPSHSPTEKPTDTALPFPTDTAEPEQEPDVLVVTPIAGGGNASLPGMMVLSLSDFGYTHLFLYHPEYLPFIRITNGEWDDMDPVLSPDGTQIAYTSHQSGYWDIYSLSLLDGSIRQITADTNYDGSPSWSPDGVWLTFEKYIDNNLEIYIVPVDGSIDPVRITTNAYVDHSPVWNPANGGRLIAFVSNRSGSDDIWIADLDNLNESLFVNASHNPYWNQNHPQWSHEGNLLAWSANHDGSDNLYTLAYGQENASPVYIGQGSQPTWAPDDSSLLALTVVDDNPYLTAYNLNNKTLSLTPLALDNQVGGISWGSAALPEVLPSSIMKAAEPVQPPSWASVLTPETKAIQGKAYIIDLADVEAPHAKLNAAAIESFYALKDRVLEELGWDALSVLENAFVSVNEPLSPGLSQSWLYTGRAIAINTAYMDAGFMQVVREDIGSQTYWRVYLFAANQDGSEGKPMTQIPWDFDARFDGVIEHYENGGKPTGVIPSGYWVDITSLTAEYGWERVPAFSNWQSYYPAARFNEFVITSGLDWYTAMLQLYPAEVILTPIPE